MVWGDCEEKCVEQATGGEAEAERMGYVNIPILSTTDGANDIWTEYGQRWGNIYFQNDESDEEHMLVS